MASIAQSLPASSSNLRWLWNWLGDELAPYPGRASLVPRMVIAATLVMILSLTYRIPNAFQGAIYVLLISRESPRATLRFAAVTLLATAIGTIYLLVSVSLVISVPLLHFLWIAGTFFLTFYALSSLADYTAAVIFAVVVSVAVPIWDRHMPAETNLEDTLWLCLATLIGVMVTAAVELAFARLRPGDEVVSNIAERLSAVENLLICYAEDCAIDTATEEKLVHLATVGTSLVRRLLRRSNYSAQYSASMIGVANLVGGLVDLAAALMQLRFEPSAEDRRRLRSLAAAIASIRNDLMSRAIPRPIPFETEEPSARGIPLLVEMERTVRLIPEVFLGSRSLHEHAPSSEDLPRAVLLAPDAFVNPEHLRFALKGTLAASGSYVFYRAADWPGISTAVTTCLLTALSTVGASHQKQILRIAGAIVGGFVLGMGSQIFILPYLDSIGGFTVLFVLVTAVSAWFLTSSPRLSYFGLQVAFAYYLINLQEFKIQTSLEIARDRVVGVLVGLFMMWIVFDQLWGSPAAVEMKRKFISSLRLLAEFAREPVSTDRRIAIARIRALRATIDSGLSSVRALADAVLFEFGPSRRKDLELRDSIRHWQTHLRALFVMRIASVKYRLQWPGFELPESVRVRLEAYDDHSAGLLEELADRIERNVPPPESSSERSQELLNATVQAIQAEDSERFAPGPRQSFLALLRAIDGLTATLASEITGTREAEN